MRGNPYSPRKHIKCMDTGEECTGDRYLSTSHWKKMRHKSYEYYKGECQRCHTVIPISQAEIHHRSYKNIGNEKMTDLILYCKRCHWMIHKSKHEAHSINGAYQKVMSSLTMYEKKKVINYIATELLGTTYEELMNNFSIKEN